MGASNDTFIKYPRTPHLSGSRGTDDDKHLGQAESAALIADPSLIVEEKLDGTNVGIHFTTAGRMVLQCRGHEITEGMHPQYDLFKQWTMGKRPVLEAMLADRFILFGEWLYARHSQRALRDLGCDLVVREEIANLVRDHGRPAHLLEKSDPAHELISLSWLVNHRLLYLLALADTRGRRTVEQARPEENLELWRLVAEENGCFDQPYAFANDQARFMFYAGELSSLHYTPHEDYCCTVTMMSGLPGSGKDTWLATYRPELPVVSLDELRDEMEVAPTDDQGEVIQLARERCREHLRAGRHFAFNATNTIRQTRKRWVDLCADYGARIELVYLEPPLPIILEQNARRARPVPTRAIERLIDKLEPPTLTESHALTYVANSGPA